MTLTKAQRERYGRVAAAAVERFDDIIHEPDHEDVYTVGAEAVIETYQQDQAARQAAMERVIAAIVESETVRQIRSGAEAVPGIPLVDAFTRFCLSADDMRRVIGALDALDATEQEAAK